MTRPLLTLLSRPGCHLCEDLRSELEREFPDRFELREACVDDRPEWKRAYGLKIPVLLAEDGSVVCSGRFDAESVAEWLE